MIAREENVPGAPVLPEQRAALERLLRSSVVGRAPRVREFLAYVAECIFEGRQNEINEQQIGCRVFGRPAGYNYTEDNIVRVTARNLRTKLEEYYATEGAGEEWIVEIPKGAYLPTFRHRVAAQPKTEAPPAAQRGVRRRQTREIVAWCLCAGLALGLLVSPRFRPVNENNPARGLVSALFPNPAERVTVVMVDSDLQLYRSVENRTVPLDSYMGGHYLQPGHGPNDEPLPESISRFLAGKDDRNTTFSSAFLAGRLLQQMPPGQVEIRHPMQLNSRDFQRNNAILLGGPWSNPWGQPFEAKLNFRIVTGEHAGGSIIKNCTPQPGEMQTYSRFREGAVETGYVRIAALPNLGGRGKVLLLGATTSGALEAAGDFVLRREHLDMVLQLLHVKRGDAIPDFELVLEVKAVDVTPQGMRVVAHRLAGQAGS